MSSTQKRKHFENSFVFRVKEKASLAIKLTIKSRSIVSKSKNTSANKTKFTEDINNLVKISRGLEVHFEIVVTRIRDF